MKIGKVTVLEELGHGAGSRVYRVRRDLDGLEYALKVVPCETRATHRFLDQARNELRIGRHLIHPNIIEIYCLETDSGWFTGPKVARLLTQYAPGRSMDRLPLLPIPRLIRVFEQVASALAHMHAQGILHADVKPNNLILGDGAEVKVIDFGIAQFRGERPDRVHATRDFMAPETGGQKLITELTDIYSFGATMYRLVTLRPPPTAITAVVMGEKEFERQYQPPQAINNRVPHELSALIGACLQYRPERRPASMEMIHAALESLAQAHPEEE